jgi:hypothetical protein
LSSRKSDPIKNSNLKLRGLRLKPIFEVIKFCISLIVVL